MSVFLESKRMPLKLVVLAQTKDERDKTFGFKEKLRLDLANAEGVEHTKNNVERRILMSQSVSLGHGDAA